MSARTEGIGTMDKKDAIRLGITGSNLRACGIDSDTRKDETYCLYDRVDFEIPTRKEGDSYARCIVRLEELQQSMNIMKQVLDLIEPGPIKQVIGGVMRGEPGEAFVRTEAARGTMFYHIVSDGEKNPYRVKISVPSFRNLIGMTHLLVGSRLADMPAIYWSLDYWPVEADR